MPARSDTLGTPQDVSAAFSSFEQALQQVLTQQAQDTVDQALAEIGEHGTFRIDSAQVEVSIRGLTVSSEAAHRQAAPANRRPPLRTARKAPRGRPTGRVRSALLAAFAGQEALSASDLRSRLDQDGIEVSADNLHQQLGRLVKAGELERPGRGIYRRC